MEGFIPFLPAHLSWDFGLLLPLDLDLHHLLPWFSGLCTRLKLHHWLSWVSSLHTSNHGTSQPSKCCEPIPLNKSPYHYLCLYLSIYILLVCSCREHWLIQICRNSLREFCKEPIMCPMRENSSIWPLPPSGYHSPIANPKPSENLILSLTALLSMPTLEELEEAI